MKTNSKRRGFSLMEVLIAMGIAGVGLCGIMTALPVIAFQVQKIRSRVSGDQLAQLAQETIRLQKWCEPTTNPNFVSWVNVNGVTNAITTVDVDKPFLIDPWSSGTPFPSSVFSWKPIPAVPPTIVGDLDSDTVSNTLEDKILFFQPTVQPVAKSFFTDPTSLKVSAHPSSERPELTYVSLNNSIAPDRNDDYSWFYTVLPRVGTLGQPITGVPVSVSHIDAYHVSVIVSRGRAFDDSATHRVYNIFSTRPGTRADTVIAFDLIDSSEPALGKYAAVVIPGYISGNYGSYLCWYKVLMARETSPVTVGSDIFPATRVLLQPVKGDEMPSPPTTGGFLITADSIIEVQSFSVQ